MYTHNTPATTHNTHNKYILKSLTCVLEFDVPIRKVYRKYRATADMGGREVSVIDDRGRVRKGFEERYTCKLIIPCRKSNLETYLFKT